MSAEPVNLNVPRMRLAVARLAKAGFRVLRVQHNDKVPVDARWTERATNNENVLDPWFQDTVYNIGVACGPQPNDINLVCIDVDTRHDGLATWAALTAINGEPDTAMHATPTGGLHVFFDSPFPVSNANRLPQGIDVRGAGGQVVVPPSTRIIDGDLLAYAAIGSRGLVEYPIAPLPEWLADLLRPIERSIERHPSAGRPKPTPGIVDNADWLRDHWDWVAVLEEQGHTFVRQVGDDVYMRHPTATSPHSAIVHLEANMMVAFSSNMPEPLRPDRQYTPDGFVKWSPYDWFTATEHGGDYSSAASEINRRRGGVAGGDRRERAAGTAAPDQDAGSHRLPVAPPEYWSASARNRHIFQAARAALVSPDALDLVVFALESILIPPTYLLPRIVGGQQPLNMLACLVAPTGLFKTATLDAARDMMGPFPPWVVQIGMGSGEGIGATFLREEMELNAKGTAKVKTGRLVRNDIKAAFFEADEGSGLTEQAGRAGATVIANLCKAWSGSTLGEANADPTKRRHVLDRDYRIAALVNIQPSNFAGLFSLANTGTGLTGRFMFSGTADYDIPDDDTPWPGVLEHPTFPDMPVTLDIAPSIIARAKASIRERHRTAALGANVDSVGQNAAVIARMAAIAVLVDGRSLITEDDWSVAQLRADASAACLETLDSWFSSVRSDADHTALKAKARASVTVETEAERMKIGQAADRIMIVLAAGPMSGGNLSAKMTTSLRAHRDDALELLVSMGKVKLNGERWETL